jgi:hypothetical protein
VKIYPLNKLIAASAHYLIKKVSDHYLKLEIHQKFSSQVIEAC